MLRIREKSKCTRLVNNRSESDPRGKLESLTQASIVNLPVPASWRQNEEETKMIKHFKSALGPQSKEIRLSEDITSQPGVNLNSSLSILTLSLSSHNNLPQFCHNYPKEKIIFLCTNSYCLFFCCYITKIIEFRYCFHVIKWTFVTFFFLLQLILNKLSYWL